VTHKGILLSLVLLKRIMNNLKEGAFMSNTTIYPQLPTQTCIPDELVLVVRRETLFAEEAWHGIKMVDYQLYEQLIKTHQEFLPRVRMETDPRYKQIIPYLIFRHDKQYFVMQRKSQASEQRLQGKLSLGIGGHINPSDLAGETVMDWARREFAEEVDFSGTLNVSFMGILNDDSNEVGRVHAGFIFLLEGDSANILPREEFKSGVLMTLEECKENYQRMESWSQMVIDTLCD
jgi:predicted NUDIX family phosphoesterase